jgi:hypothetical protein
MAGSYTDRRSPMAEVLPMLPLSIPLETLAVLKKAVNAYRFLAEHKRRCRAIPNQGILISTLALRQAKDSSEIKNIVRTQDELFVWLGTRLCPSSPSSGRTSPHRAKNSI